jgi:hypothetical protein
MECPSENDRLLNLFTHPMLEESFADPSSRTLDGALQELCQYGQPVLAAHDSDSVDGEIVQEWVCSMNWRTSETDMLSAAGRTPLLAALYCLLECAYYTQKQVRRSMPELDFGMD